MNVNNHLLETSQARFCSMPFVLTAMLGFIATTPLFAQKGNGKGGGGGSGGSDVELVSAPVEYRVTWLDLGGIVPGTPSDHVYARDVNPKFQDR